MGRRVNHGARRSVAGRGDARVPARLGELLHRYRFIRLEETLGEATICLADSLELLGDRDQVRLPDKALFLRAKADTPPPTAGRWTR